MGQLKPGTGKGIFKPLMIAHELFGHLSEARIELHRHIGGGHDRWHLLRGVARIGSKIIRLWIDRGPLPCSGRRFHQFIFVFEQQAKIVFRPFERRVGPSALDPGGRDMALCNLFGIRRPSKTHEMQILPLRCRAELVWRYRAMAFTKSVTASSQCNGFRVVHRHPAKGFANVARHALHIVGIAPRTFRIDVNQAHLNRRERILERLALIWNYACLDSLVDPLFFGSPID